MVMALEEAVRNDERLKSMPHEVQTPLQLFTEKKKANRKLADTIQLHHEQAYTSAAEKHLKDKEGLFDYSKLENAATQEKFAEHMADFYVTKARQYFGVGKDIKLNEQQVDMLLSAYSGITKTELTDTIRKAGEDFTLDTFKSAVDQVRQQIGRRLDATAASHVKEEHKVGIIKEMKLEDLVDATKMTAEQVIGLMQTYHANQGLVPAKSYKKEVYYKKRAPAKEPVGAHH